MNYPVIFTPGIDGDDGHNDPGGFFFPEHFNCLIEQLMAEPLFTNESDFVGNGQDQLFFIRENIGRTLPVLNHVHI